MKRNRFPSNKEIEKTFRFVISEIVRLSKIDFRDEASRDEIENFDFFYTIDGPNNKKKLLGRKAYQEVHRICRAYIAAEPRLDNRIQVTTLTKCVLKNMFDQFIEPNDLSGRDFIDLCANEVLTTGLISEKYFIPCICPNHTAINRFKIGPVEFIRKKDFFDMKARHLHPQNKFTFDDIDQKYKLYNWIAIISISGFDEETSEERAYLAARLAVAALKPKMDISLSQWLGTDQQMMPSLTRFTIKSKKNSDAARPIYIGWSQKFILNGDDSQVENLLNISSHHWFNEFGALLAYLINNGRWGYLETRIFNAIIWMDTGNSPISNAEKIIAFANCLEALFATSESNIKKQIEDRCSIFLKFAGWDSGMNSKVGSFYNVRSRLVHGEKNPIQDNLHEIMLIGKYLTDVCLVGFLHFSLWLKHKHKSKKTEEHDLPYNGKNSFDRHIEKEMQEFIGELEPMRGSG